jgi:hypothetical protein
VNTVSLRTDEPADQTALITLRVMEEHHVGTVRGMRSVDLVDASFY